jgi:hypothetical protein
MRKTRGKMNKGSTQLSLPRSLACKNARPGLFLAFNPEVFHSMSRNWLPLLVPASLILLIWMLLPVSEESNAMTSGLPERPDYNFHVKPILSDKCFACHGPDEKQRKAGLRLDIREEAMAELRKTRGGKPYCLENLQKAFSSREFGQRIRARSCLLPNQISS